MNTTLVGAASTVPRVGGQQAKAAVGVPSEYGVGPVAGYDQRAVPGHGDPVGDNGAELGQGAPGAGRTVGPDGHFDDGRGVAFDHEQAVPVGGHGAAVREGGRFLGPHLGCPPGADHPYQAVRRPPISRVGHVVVALPVEAAPVGLDQGAGRQAPGEQLT